MLSPILLSLCASDFRAAKYPYDFGSYEKPNKVFDKLVKLGLVNLHYRHLLGEKEGEAEWRTYRDVIDTSELRSVFTGQEATRLPRHWLDMFADDPDLLG